MRIYQMPCRKDKIHRQFCIYNPLLRLRNLLRQSTTIRAEDCRVAASLPEKRAFANFVSVDASLRYYGRTVENECCRFYGVGLGKVLGTWNKVTIM